MAAAAMPPVAAFWRGELPLGRAFWGWGILGGALVNLVATLAAMFLLVAEAPAWLAAMIFAAPIPWNLALIAGVWRSAAHAGTGLHGDLARIAILVWALILCLL
jgi:hypothetical protein